MKRKVLITGGPCRETIDGVRTITNSSSGKTSETMAHSLFQKDFEVHLLTSVSDGKYPFVSSSFSDYRSLDSRLKTLLKNENFDLVIHSAAVSDYTVTALEVNGELLSPDKVAKLPSNASLSIHLENTEKIVNKIKTYSKNPSSLKVIAFKLTKEASSEQRIQAGKKILKNGNVDAVILNDLSEINRNTHPFTIIDKDGTPLSKGSQKKQIGEEIVKHF